MKLAWVNDGHEFVPETELGDMEDSLEAEIAIVERQAKAKAAGEAATFERSLLERVRMQRDFVARILQRTDPRVTVETVRKNVRPGDLVTLFKDLMSGPQQAAEEALEEAKSKDNPLDG